MTRCVFCSIVKRELQAYRVFESDRVLAFLDIHPSAPGHTLVIPKRHVTRVEELVEADAEAVFMAVYHLVGGVQGAVGAPASTIGINNGPESGQEVPHLHVHIIPRKSRSEGGIIQGIVRRSTNQSLELEEIAENIRRNIGWSPDNE
jgi:histidine triad (HIT) family protein